MKTRIIFVGIHNKPNLSALCSSTKTGKLVNRIVEKLPKSVEILKTNVFDVDYYPPKHENSKLCEEWFWTHMPDSDDIVVLLGNMVHVIFKSEFSSGRRLVHNVIRVAHPASKRSHVDMDKYVLDVAKQITQKLS